MEPSAHAPDPLVTVDAIEHALARSEASTRSAGLENLFRGLRLELSRIQRTARAEFDGDESDAESGEPYATEALALLAVLGAVDRSLKAHEAAREHATDARDQVLFDTQLERLRAMARQIERHANPSEQL